jgi:hypothetical protein
MSYATMQDVLFDLYLSDSEVRHCPRRHPDTAAAKPELPEERGESVAQPKAVVEVRRAA